jgi:hypothetical protein
MTESTETRIDVRKIISDVFESIKYPKKDELTVDEIMDEPPKGMKHFKPEKYSE